VGDVLKNDMARLISALSETEKENAARAAADVLGKGGLVVFPTESFYGLGVDPFNEMAVRNLFHAKGRSPDRPILLLIPSADMVKEYARDISGLAEELMEAFWPGGLTLVFNAFPRVSPLLTAGTGKIGLRVSGHPLARAVCKAFGGAVTGTSANVSERPACETAAEAISALGDKVDMVLDGGRTPGGLPSTVLDMTENPPVVLRHGMVNLKELNKAEYLRITLAGESAGAQCKCSGE